MTIQPQLRNEKVKKMIERKKMGNFLCGIILFYRRMEAIQKINLSQQGLCPEGTLIKEIFFEGIFKKKMGISLVTNQESEDSVDSVKEKESDFRNFLWKTKKNAQNLYPSVFQLIKIPCKILEPVQNFENFNFPVLSYSKDQLGKVSGIIIRKINPNIEEKILNAVIRRILTQYNIVSYHNFSHGFSLMHMLYHCFRMDSKFSNLYSPEEKSFALVAALGHDIMHQGTNNDFQVKTNSENAQIAENKAALEKMHVRTLMKILEQKDCQLLQKAQNPAKIKQLMIRLILATDVSRHFSDLTKMKSLSEFKTNEQNRMFTLEQVFHGCDIGNPCLEKQQYLNWAALLSYEFNQQTIMEQKMDIKVTEFFKYKGFETFYKGQIGFINGLVLPLWSELSIRWDGFIYLVKNIQENRRQLQEELDKGNQ